MYGCVGACAVKIVENSRNSIYLQSFCALNKIMVYPVYIHNFGFAPDPNTILYTYTDEICG